MRNQIVSSKPMSVGQRNDINEWMLFYSEVFGIESDFSQLSIPVSQEGFGWLLFASDHISNEEAFQKCRERFGAWKYTNRLLDQDVPINDRDRSNGAYAIWLRETVEADEVHKSKSANDLKAAGIKGITLRERLLLELFYEWKNLGQHLDLKNWTLCAGSRGSGGNVPHVFWYGGKLEVLRYGPDYRHDSLRSREAVS